MPVSGLTASGPRSLLRQIREVMASDAPAQSRLDQVVASIARLMVTEVCSVYLRRGSGDMELFATQGLNPEAVHTTRLKPGEGLVGEVVRTAQPIALSDAPSHPSFSYRPETGEDPFHGFLGVPLLRGGRVVGVLVVQNRTARTYGEDEIEDLQTISMVLAEVVAGVEEAIDQLGDVEVAPHRPERLKGQRFSDGLAIGQAVLHDPPIASTRIVAEDPVAEEARLDEGLARLRTQIDALLSVSHLSGPSIEVLETYRMFADDRGWVRSLREAVRGGLSAEAAVDRARTQHRARFAAAKDAYLRERLHDLEDLANRLLRILAGEEPGHRDLPENAILVARNLGPADLLEYPAGALKGLLLEEGSSASHAALVARALEIPCVGRLAGLEPTSWRRSDRAWRSGRRAAPTLLCCATVRPSPWTARRSPCSPTPACCRTFPPWRRPAPRGSACSAPNSSSWCRTSFRASTPRPSSTAGSSTRPRVGPSPFEPSTSAATRS